VSAWSADLAPRAGEVSAAGNTAVTGFQAVDGQNATDLQAVGETTPAQLAGQLGSGTAPETLAQNGSPLAGGQGEIEQVVSSVASGVSAPVTALDQLTSPAEVISGTPMSGLTGPQTHVSHTADASDAAPPRTSQSSDPPRST
jgi:hypothetical protein